MANGKRHRLQVGDTETKPAAALARRRDHALALEPDALVLPRRLRLPWQEILGVVELGEGRRERLYVLARRAPPASPWFEIHPRMLRASGITTTLGELAASIRGRLGHVGYREGAGSHEKLSAQELLQSVIEGTRLPGALEIVRGRGPRRLLTRLAEGVAAAGAGAVGGAILGAFVGAPLAHLLHLPRVLGLSMMAIGAALGLALTLPSVSWIARVRGHRARVLVLTPDGCVVGLPDGPRAFAWSSVGNFEIAKVASHGHRLRDGLRIVDAEGLVLGEIDRAWFAGRLELVVAVANAYRARVR